MKEGLRLIQRFVQARQSIGDWVTELLGGDSLDTLRKISRPLTDQEKNLCRDVIENIVTAPYCYVDLDEFYPDYQTVVTALSLMEKRQGEFGIDDMEELRRQTYLKLGIVKFCYFPLLQATPFGDRHKRCPDCADEIAQDVTGYRFTGKKEDRAALYQSLFSLWSDDEKRVQAVRELRGTERLVEAEKKSEEQERAIKKAKDSGIYIPDRQLYSARSSLRNERERLEREITLLSLDKETLIEIGQASGEEEIYCENLVHGVDLLNSKW